MDLTQDPTYQATWKGLLATAKTINDGAERIYEQACANADLNNKPHPLPPVFIKPYAYLEGNFVRYDMVPDPDYVVDKPTPPAPVQNKDTDPVGDLIPGSTNAYEYKPLIVDAVKNMTFTDPRGTFLLVGMDTPFKYKPLSWVKISPAK